MFLGIYWQSCFSWTTLSDGLQVNICLSMIGYLDKYFYFLDFSNMADVFLSSFHNLFESLHPYLLSTDHNRLFFIHSCLLPAISDCLNCEVLMIITVFFIQCHDCIFLCDYFWDVVMIRFSLEPIFVPLRWGLASFLLSFSLLSVRQPWFQSSPSTQVIYRESCRLTAWLQCPWTA